MKKIERSIKQIKANETEKHQFLKEKSQDHIQCLD